MASRRIAPATSSALRSSSSRSRHGSSVWSIAQSAPFSYRRATSRRPEAWIEDMARCYALARLPGTGWPLGPALRLPLLILCVFFGLLVPAAAASADGGPIMPLSAVQAGMNCTGETVVQGTTISSFNVHVIDVVQAPGEGARILISAS